MADFTVVESSTARELTPAQLAELRQAVINYLEEQGQAANGVYYVKVTLPAANPGEDPQWAVVRIGNPPVRTYTMLAAYPGPDDSYPYDYYYWDGYYAGNAQFARFGYYDPFDHNYGYVTRPRRDHKPDDRPGDKPDHPRPTPTSWDNNRPDPDHPRWRDRDHPDNPSPRNGTRNHPDDGDRNRDGGGSRDWGRDHPSSPGGSSAAPRPAYTPQPAPVRSDPPARSEPAPQARDDKRSAT